MKKILGILVFVLVIASILVGCSKPAPAPATAAPIVLKAIAMVPLPNGLNDYYKVIIDTINKKAGGELRIDLLGGPEIVDTYDQPQAIINGVVDMTHTFPDTYKSNILETCALGLSEITPQEERTRGFYDFMVELHKKVGLRYLGRTISYVPFYVMLHDKRVEKLQDLNGLRIATASIFLPGFKKLGIVGVAMSMGEKYTAVERGLCDGLSTPISDAIDMSYLEVSKYWIDHPIFTFDVVMIMSLDKWNQLPEHLQSLIENTVAELEQAEYKYFQDRDDKFIQEIVKRGMQPLTFSPEEAQTYVQAMRDGLWEEVKASVTPDSYLKLRKFLVK